MLVNEKTRTKKYYSVGYSPTLNKYILSETVSYVAWYNRYYEITEAEFKLAEENVDALDCIADICIKAGTSSERYLCSGKTRENTEQQSAVFQELRRGFIPYSREKDQII